MSYKGFAVTKKELNKVFIRYLLGSQMSWNYESMQAGGVVLTLAPILRKIYSDDDEYKQALQAHFTFYNTNVFIGSIIMGSVIAVEEMHEEAGLKTTREAVASIKTGLMGPMAGIGDAVLAMIPMTIFGAIAANMAMNGSPVGILFGVGYCTALLFARRWLMFMGYRQGNKFVSQLSGQLKNLTNSASILGLMVVGSLIATAVKVNIPLIFQQGEVKLVLQDTLNMVMPNLIPVLLTALIYFLLGKKNFTSTKAVFLLIFIAFLGYFLGLFGV